MSDVSWDAYLKLMPAAAVVGVDKHGAVNLFDGPIFFSVTAGRWCPINESVAKVSVGLMPVTGDFSPDTAYKLNPANTMELAARVMAAIKGGSTADPVPGQWTGTLNNSAEMTKMKEAVAAAPPLPRMIGFMEPDYQINTPPLFKATEGTPSVVDRGDIIKVETGVVSTSPAPLVVSPGALVAAPSKNAVLASQLREQATKLLTLAETLERS